jgi:signal transduction histidine kinase
MEAAVTSSGVEALLHALTQAVGEFVSAAGERQRFIQLVSERVGELLNVNCEVDLLSEGEDEGSVQPATVLAGGAEDWLVPLSSGTRTWGALRLKRTRPEAPPLSTIDTRVAQHLAQAAAMALEQAATLATVEHQLRERELQVRHEREHEASRLKTEFLANMSHELRTPLNAIIGFSSLMHAGRVGKLTDTQVEYLGDILVSSRHLLQLINDVLDLAKVEAGKLEPHSEPLEPSRLAVEVRDILRGRAAEKHIDITLEIAPDVGELRTDSRLLKQVLYNFLSNAIKFTLDGGSVRVRIKVASSDTFKVEVEDNGIGIKPDDLRRLFMEFQRLDSRSATGNSGAGLGLALTKQIVEALGGSVAVVSVLGKGSVFSAELPRTLTLPLEGMEHGR